jgi:hypothetical protein
MDRHFGSCIDRKRRTQRAIAIVHGLLNGIVRPLHSHGCVVTVTVHDTGMIIRIRATWLTIITFSDLYLVCTGSSKTVLWPINVSGCRRMDDQMYQYISSKKDMQSYERLVNATAGLRSNACKHPPILSRNGWKVHLPWHRD